MPRSARSSSTSRYDSAKRRHQRTARTITSGGKQKPANADRAMGAGQGRRGLMGAVCLLRAPSPQMQQRPFGVAAVSFATSYGALYAYVRDTGLYSDRLTRIWPLLLDGAFIVAQLAAILAGILRGSRGWPIVTMLLTGALTVWFNLQHAGADPGQLVRGALPPVLMMLAFEIDIQIVKWVMTALGKPLGPIAPPPADGMVQGAVWRSYWL